MAKWYFDDDGDLSLLDGKTVGIFGYGNQGRSQALNMRDNGIEVLVGSRDDSSAETATKDGFTMLPLAEAAARADILFLLVPDEIMPSIYAEYIEPHLVPGNLLVFASAYNIHFGHITPKDGVDVVLVAPRMVGKGVRDTFVAGTGFPSLVAVGQDATGEAHQRMIALAKAIGSTKMGVIESSFEEETVVDLFHEQWGFIYAVRRAFDVLTEAGCSPEAVMLELYASGELAEMGGYMRDIGLFHQVELHSHTSQFGQEVIGKLSPEQEETDKKRLREIVSGIKDGSFAKRWAKDQENGLVELKAAHKAAIEHPMIQEERKLFKILGRA